MDEAIRTKIEQRLAEDKESYEGEEDKEFEDLNSYLLGAAARVQKYTAESLGYRIFKKYMRQDVPGIGASIETQQVRKDNSIRGENMPVHCRFSLLGDSSFRSRKSSISWIFGRINRNRWSCLEISGIGCVLHWIKFQPLNLKTGH